MLLINNLRILFININVLTSVDERKKNTKQCFFFTNLKNKFIMIFISNQRNQQSNIICKYYLATWTIKMPSKFLRTFNLSLPKSLTTTVRFSNL